MSDPILNNNINNNVNQINDNANIQPNEDLKLEDLPLELLKPKESLGWKIFKNAMFVLGGAALTVLTAGFSVVVYDIYKSKIASTPSFKRMLEMNTGDPEDEKEEKKINWRYEPSKDFLNAHTDDLKKPVKKNALSLFNKAISLSAPSTKKGTQELCNLMAEFKDGHHENDWIFDKPVAEFTKHVGNDIADKIISKKLGKEYILDVEGQRELTLKAVVCRKLTIDCGGPDGVAKAFEGKTNQECYDLIVKTLNRLAQPYAEEINQLHANNQVNQPENPVNQPENQENPPA